MTFRPGPALALISMLVACHATAPPPQTQAPVPCGAAVARVWHGRTATTRADEYAAYLEPAITKFRTLPGNLGYQMMRETIGDETHFTVISYWRSREAIHGYAGADISRTRNLPRDPEFLIELEPTVKNYDLVVQSFDCPSPPR